MVYGPAGEMKTMQFRTSTGGYYTEARSYNNRVQMTERSASGAGLTGLDLQYNYGAAGSNIGKIASITDAISGEQVTYMYDALQRLSQSETTHSQTTYPGAPWWGQSFGYDGFGNLTTKSPTAGHTATSMSLSVDPVTNHITSSGFAYDANGNMTSIAAAPSNIALSYDVENRTGGQWFDMENRPMLKNGQWYLYGLHGERLGTFTGSATVMNFPGTSVFYVATTQTQTSRNIYFAGRLIQSNGKTVVRDQVGSVRVNEDGEKFEYYPFGEEITLHNPQDREKFGTYTRDSATGLDDANQRTYASVHGLFSSPDRYAASAGAGEPGSWNRYVYTRGDPVNRLDRRGTCDEDTNTVVNVCDSADEIPTTLADDGFGNADRTDRERRQEDRRWSLAVERLHRGLGLLNDLADGKQETNPQCQSDLNGIVKTLGLSIQDIALAASGAQYNDAFVSTDRYADLFPPGSNDATLSGTASISQVLSNVSSPTVVVAALPGSPLAGNIYFNSRFVNGLSNGYTAALLLHESVHLLGSKDPGLLTSLDLKSGDPITDHATALLAKDCFGVSK